jgi:hypothetical protein
MKYLRAFFVAAAAAAVVVACSSTGNELSSGTAGSTVASTTATSSSVASATSTSTSTSTVASSSATSASSSSGTTGVIHPTGGTLDTLSFAVVGDTRPPNEDDTGGYPTDVITKIWADLEAASPRPAFVVTTGDYQYANPNGTQSKPQLTLYMNARQQFSNIVFPVMGNHECTGFTASNCGEGNSDGITANYTNFMSMMLGPLGATAPFYSFNVNGTNGAWTAKFVMVACNAWDQTQATWLDGELAKPTTYTFVVRHEGNDADTAPCVTPMQSILSSHPLTLLIAGHTHTFEFNANSRQMIVGNGGAPLSGNINYGYTLATQQPNGTITYDEYDYMTNQVVLNYNLSK